MDPLVNLIFFWYVVGWLNVAVFCRFFLTSLTTCQLMAQLLLLPFLEAMGTIIATSIIVLLWQNWLLLIAYAIIGTFLLGALFLALYIGMRIEDSFDNICTIIWRKQKDPYAK